MKVASIVSAVLMMFVVGCTSDKTEPAPKPTPEASITEPEIRAFASIVRSEIPPTAVFSDAELLLLGNMVCDEIEPLAPLSTLELGIFASGFHSETRQYLTQDQAAKFVGYSIGAYCPDSIE